MRPTTLLRAAKNVRVPSTRSPAPSKNASPKAVPRRPASSSPTNTLKTSVPPTSPPNTPLPRPISSSLRAGRALPQAPKALNQTPVTAKPASVPRSPPITQLDETRNGTVNPRSLWQSYTRTLSPLTLQDAKWSLTSDLSRSGKLIVGGMFLGFAGILHLMTEYGPQEEDEKLETVIDRRRGVRPAESRPS
jgi:hypothetical protein